MSKTRVGTGVRMLDTMLDGGFPEERSVLVTGEPGTGKSTLGMQFLQEGIGNGEECLFVSTEQTVDELKESFSPFGFELDHDNLTVATVHATPEDTLESDEREMTLQTLDEGEVLDEDFEMPFTGEYIQRYLSEYGPCDRVVFDSVSGLSVISEDESVYRRTVLDLVRLFNDEMGATSVFTSEYVDGEESDVIRVSPGNEVQFTTHGVIRLWHEEVNDDLHRFLRVNKMRGTDHDTRKVELEFGDEGISLSPRRRSQPPSLKQHKHLPVGIEGLDRLCGGGVVRGAGVLLQHSGRANLSALLSTLLSAAVEKSYSVVLFPSVYTKPERLKSMFHDHDASVDQLFENDRLFVVDMIGAWEESRREDSIFSPDGIEEVRGVAEEIGERTGNKKQFSLVNTSATVHTLGVSGARDLRYYQEANLGTKDMLINVHNPSLIADEVSEFFVDVSEQILKTWVSDDGLQYISLTKSPCGFVGSTSLVEYEEEPPYLRVQNPPRSRENPMTVDD